MSRRGVAWLVWALAGTPAAGAGPAEKVQEGNRHYLAGDLEAALAEYTKAQVELPDSSVLHYNIGNVLFRQGEYARAVDEYRRAELSDDGELRARARFNIGNAHFLAQEYAPAVEDYAEVLRQVPDDVEAKRNLELALQALQQEPPQEEPSSSEQPESEEPEQGEQQSAPQPGPQDPESPSDEEGADPGPAGEPQPSEDPSGGKPDRNPGQDRMEGAPQPQEGTLPEQEAARILDALKQQERENMKKALRPPRTGRGTGKDW